MSECNEPTSSMPHLAIDCDDGLAVLVSGALHVEDLLDLMYCLELPTGSIVVPFWEYLIGFYIYIYIYLFIYIYTYIHHKKELQWSLWVRLKNLGGTLTSKADPAITQ